MLQRREAEIQHLLPFLEMTTVFLGLMETDGTLIRVNSAALNAINATQESLVNQLFWLCPWWTHDAIQQERLRTAIKRAARGDSPNFEVTHIQADGKTIYVDFRLHPVRNAEGGVIWLLAEGRDITAHKLAEKKLASERAILRTVIDSIPDLISYKDANSIYLGCNKAFEKYFGKPESQIVGRTDYYFVDTKTADGFRAQDQKVSESAVPIMNDEWVRYPDGRRVLLETLKAPIRSEDNKILGLLGISRDITERNRADEALRQSEERYRQLFENMTTGFALHEVQLDISGKPVDYRFIEVNPAYEELTGLKGEAIIGRTVREVLPEIESLWIEQYGQVAISGDSARFESYVKELGRWFSVRAFCPRRGYFAVLVSDVTERRESEAALRRQKAQLRAILENFPFMVWLKDTEGRYLDANQELAQASGVPNVDALIGKTDFDLWPAELAKNSEKADREVMSTQAHSMTEVLSADGSQWWEVFRTPIQDAEGALLGTAGFTREITGRKRSEAVLRASQAHYQALLDASPVGVLEADATGQCVYVNQKYTAITGLTLDMAKDEGWARAVHPHDLPRLLQLRSDALEARDVPDSYEYRHIRPDGSMVWVMAHAAMMRTVDDRLSGIMVTLVDITERKEMENRLRLSASLFEVCSEGIMVVDADNRIISVNPAFTALLGYESAEVLGRNPGEWGSSRNSPSLYKNLWSCVDETGHWQGEVWNNCKNGDEIALWMSINTLRNQKGEVQWRFALFSDVTERKRAEEVIWRQANYDTLTGLPNRRLFRDRLQQDMKKVSRSKRMLALFFIDLDRFKEVNDTFGHDCGDALLVEAGQRIRACVRETDTVARMGGDEFTAILPDLIDEERAVAVAKSILSTLEIPFTIEGVEASISASIGIAFFPKDADTDVKLLKQADRAMYFAKAQGRNCYSKLS